jgi:hypothetical protein
MQQPTDNPKEAHCSVCGFENLKALYCLNTVAKEYAESAETSYNSGMKRRARIHSQRKTALYGLKRAILGQFIDNGCVDEVRTHEIDGREYYCVYVGEFSFHTPTSEWDTPPENAPDSAVELESFDADANSRSKDMSEREALTRLSEVFESPNHHIESPFTDDNFGRKFVGWSYLPGALEEGDRVPDRHLHDHNGEGDFIFKVGDTFQTGEGECEIVDRYHAYLTPLRDRSPLLQREAYDIILDGEKKEGVRRRRIVDDWWILADSIADPIPDVNGSLSDIVRGAIERHDAEINFEIGDILELQPMTDGESPMYCRLTEAHVSANLLIGQYEPVPPSDDAPMGLTVEEIDDDVVAVHDEPPVEGDE